MAAVTAMPSASPSTPPATPCTNDSPTTWRTTCRCVQPSAFSVPSSRTRFPTDASVRSAASRNAANAARAASAIPSRCERFDASTSEPLIWSVTCFALATCAFGNFASIAFCTSPTEVPESARTSTTFVRFFWLASDCSFASGT